jgi:hypothetical protein
LRRAARGFQAQPSPEGRRLAERQQAGTQPSSLAAASRRQQPRADPHQATEGPGVQRHRFRKRATGDHRRQRQRRCPAPAWGRRLRLGDRDPPWGGPRRREPRPRQGRPNRPKALRGRAVRRAAAGRPAATGRQPVDLSLERQLRPDLGAASGAARHDPATATHQQARDSLTAQAGRQPALACRRALVRVRRVGTGRRLSAHQ